MRTGAYVADDYVDNRLMMYDDLFRDWEKIRDFKSADTTRLMRTRRCGTTGRKCSLVDARNYMRASAPRTPQAHLIESALGNHLFVADGSRLFDADAETVRALRRGDDAGRPMKSMNCFDGLA